MIKIFEILECSVIVTRHVMQEERIEHSSATVQGRKHFID